MEKVQRHKSCVEIKYRRWHCSVCDIFTNSYVQLDQHLEGIGHRHKIMARNNNKNNNVHDEQETNFLFYMFAFIQVLITSFIVFYIVIKFCN